MMEKLDILIFGAHADDAEIGMGGTIAKHTAAGLKVGICDLTEAEMSSNGTVEIRKVEAEAASEVLGLTLRRNLQLPDRGLYVTTEQVEAVASVIRDHAPSIVFAPYWDDRHPDHVQCSKIVEDAVFNAKLRKWMPDKPAVTVDELYFYFINDWRTPDLIVDITDVYPIKEKSMQCYVSQFTLAADGVKTVLTQGYVERVKARDSLIGQRKRITYAEGFAVKSPYKVHLFDSQ
ncbi:bacillithiol biosynthesis deacetylase BshB1 [Paenibacillus shirakamiensis]|uniref:Bacillithiol biosynthesis deacetylase BshB1 n=1 Tax=Paenibacillus shirakamiensis TaxID=1265935 RepID=A0ABS4JF33_9BACL|nr:bacillithiol biosynthesis deacetylase BshB1 [Paenibacillus shirakamiensis]MBP1999571.1 bacillithiol biosynthesis deacetylase BshB1 [Paenibacillus shirakamiensis]